jgi:hypothetical protein
MLHRAVVVVSACLSAHASAQLFGVTATGTVVRIDPATGAGTVIGASGFDCNAATGDSAGRILVGGGSGAAADQIIAIDPATAAGSVLLNTIGRPFGFGVRGMAMSASGLLYVVLSPASTTAIDTLATIDMTSGAYTVIGPTTRTDIQSLAFAPTGDLYAIGIFAGGTLYQINTTTGAATVIGGGSFAGDSQALEVLPDGTAVSCQANLRSVSLSTGATTLIGATGQTDIRGLAFIGAPPQCYANCDGSNGSPLLTANDFSCFLNSYVNGQSYADCDGIGGLTANDFQCFLAAYVNGCS